MLSESQLQSLREFLEQVSDTRGLRYPTGTLLTIVLAARMAGRQTLARISDFGRAMSQRTLRLIGARLRPQTERHHAPGVSTLHYALGKIEAPDPERLTAEWMQAQGPEEQAVAIDGKNMRVSYCDDLDADGQPRASRPGSCEPTTAGAAAATVPSIAITGASKRARSGSAWRSTATCPSRGSTSPGRASPRS